VLFPVPFSSEARVLAAGWFGLSAHATYGHEPDRRATTMGRRGEAAASPSCTCRRVKSSGEKSRRAEWPAVRPAAVPAGLHYWWCSGRPAAGHSASTVPPAFALLAPLFRSIIQTLGQAGNLARPAPELAEAIDTIADHWCRFS